MPNSLISTAIRKHLSEIILPSTSDCKEKINQFLNKVSLTLIDCIYKNFKQYSPKGEDFNPSDLNLILDNKKRLVTANTTYNFFKHGVEILNTNLIRNTDHLLRKF